MSSQVSCPQCSLSVAKSALAVHLHLDLDYFAWRCGICRIKFASIADAQTHFASDFSTHPGVEENILEVHDPDKLRILTSIYREALGRPTQQTQKASDTYQCATAAKRSRLMEVSSPIQEIDQQGVSELECPTPIPSPFTSSPSPASPPPPAARVKSELMDGAELLEAKFTASAPTDGKVACILCGTRQTKDTFHHHAFRRHMDARPFLCDRCPYRAKQRHHVALHQKTAHPDDATSVTSLMDGLKDEIRLTIEQCFGTTAEIPHARADCRSCRVPVLLMKLKGHIVTEHLKKSTSACRLCDFESDKWGLAEMRRHVRRSHDQALSNDNYDDFTPALAHLISSMKVELFGKNFI